MSHEYGYLMDFDLQNTTSYTVDLLVGFKMNDTTLHCIIVAFFGMLMIWKVRLYLFDRCQKFETSKKWIYFGRFWWIKCKIPHISIIMAWQAERGKWRRGRGRGPGSVLQTPGEAKTRGQRTLDLSQWLLVDSDSGAGLIKSLQRLKTFSLRE